MLEFLKIADNLKNIKRFSAAPEMVEKESTADHSWKLTLMVYLIAEQLKLNIDRFRAVKIALIHDLVEAECGDVDYRDIVTGKVSKEAKKEQEQKAMLKIMKTLPKDLSDEVVQLWLEYEKGETIEAIYVKAMDKIETISHLVNTGYETYDIPEIIATYADKHVKKIPALIPLLRQIKAELKKEFEKGGFPWKSEYDLV